MWIIWKEEFKKIAARKIVWIAAILLLGFVTFRLFAELDAYTVTIDGKSWHGREALLKDQSLTEKYTGILTEKKIRQIYEKYGFYLFDAEDSSVELNFCNKYITLNFTNFMQTSGTDPQKIHFLEGDEWEYNVEPYLKNRVNFGYISGWDDFVEIYMMVLISSYIILLVGLSPIFAEEYMLKTADIVRTTKRGKGSGIWMKISAACVFSLLFVFLSSIYVFVIYLSVYGARGLDSSAVLLTFASFYGYCPGSVGGFLIFMGVLGVFGTLLLTGITLGFSSSCRNSFLALILSLTAFFIPVLWVKVLGPMSMGSLGPAATKAVTHLMTSTPIYLPMSPGFAFSGRQLALHFSIASASGAFGMIYGYYKYQRCGRN